MKLYLLECWTHATYPGPDGQAHDTYNAGIFSSKERALKYARENPTYAGDKDDWDWVITMYYLDEDNESASIPVHYNRFAEVEEDPASCTSDMTDDEKEWEDEYNHEMQYALPDYDEDEEEEGNKEEDNICEDCGENIYEDCDCDGWANKEEDDEDPVIIKNGTTTVTQPVNTQEDVEEFIERLKKLKPELPHREVKTRKQQVAERLLEIFALLDEEEE